MRRWGLDSIADASRRRSRARSSSEGGPSPRRREKMIIVMCKICKVGKIGAPSPESRNGSTISSGKRGGLRAIPKLLPGSGHAATGSRGLVLDVIFGMALTDDGEAGWRPGSGGRCRANSSGSCSLCKKCWTKGAAPTSRDSRDVCCQDTDTTASGYRVVGVRSVMAAAVQPPREKGGRKNPGQAGVRRRAAWPGFFYSSRGFAATGHGSRVRRAKEQEGYR
jgi:hypothetical protein